MEKIRVGIVGYGNLGMGVEEALSENDDMSLVSIFTRRDPKTITPATDTPVISLDDINDYQDKIDVMILCGGSATDLPVQGPKIAGLFNTVDSFDTHTNIPEYFEAMDDASIKGKKVSIISGGWDPGMFSIARMYGAAILPNGLTYTYWGPGISQGHSDAIRRIKDVKDARQYTRPIESAMERVRAGENPKLTTREMHTRDCYVVAEEGADLARIEREIKSMPNYFSDYDTSVTFISEAELKEKHSGMPHGGYVIRSGNTGDNNQTIEYALKLGSNPEFTGSILVALARATYRMWRNADIGCKTVGDIPPVLLLNMSREDIIKKYI